MTKFCSALLYLENLLTNIFAKLNLHGGVSCMPAALLFIYKVTSKTFCPFKPVWALVILVYFLIISMHKVSLAVV